MHAQHHSPHSNSRLTTPHSPTETNSPPHLANSPTLTHKLMSRRRTKERDEQHEAKQKAPPPTKRRATSFKKTTKENATTTSSLTSDFLTIASTLIPLLLAVLALLCLPTVLGEDRGGEILDKALLKAFKGGIPGFFAATIQILAKEKGVRH